MKRKFIIIQGSDDSREATQSSLLHKALKEAGYPIRYENPSPAIVEMYLERRS